MIYIKQKRLGNDCGLDYSLLFVKISRPLLSGPRWGSAAGDRGVEMAQENSAR